MLSILPDQRLSFENKDNETQTAPMPSGIRM
jgi:hypothetical protein